MRLLEFNLQRDILEPRYTLGQLFLVGKRYGYTCEDTDRKLEVEPGAKIKGQTAIPRGRYRLTVTFSNRFQKELPLLENVPGFEGIRVHGGNHAGLESYFLTIPKNPSKAVFSSVEYVEVVK